MMISLPIDGVLPELISILRRRRNAVLSAEPGAGKTTRVPLALLDEQWCQGRSIVMLEPRRLAASRAASYMAQQLGESVGETVGYRIRGETRVGPKTRIEVVTEGVLTRLFQADRTLEKAALVIFDEFHERSIHADLGLALTLDVQRNLRDDLRVLIMSATLNGLALSFIMDDAPVLTCKGTMFPVTTRYLDSPVMGAIEPVVASTAVRALHALPGDVLVFVPGQREIRRVESLLREAELPGNVRLHTLSGEVSPVKQQEALESAPPGSRKVIIATSIAETSLTIDGIRIVVDSGLARISEFDPRRGMSGLTTTAVSQDSADQRKGRAGRLESGICFRLWTKEQHKLLPPFRQPEIMIADLAGFVLETARWGNQERLRFLDTPPSAHIAQARSLLVRLGAIDHYGTLTEHGTAMAALPVHPRLAHVLLRGKEVGLGGLACDVAALLEERDLLRGGKDADIDLAGRLQALRDGRGGGIERIRRQAARLRALAGIDNHTTDGQEAGILLALAYPERVAKRRDNKGTRYQMAGGAGAILPGSSLLARERFLAVGDVDGVGSEVRVFLAAPLREEEIRDVFSDQLTTVEEVRWDVQQESVVAQRITRFGAITLSASLLTDATDAIQTAVLEGVRRSGLDALPWTKDAISLRTRSEWLRVRGLVDGEWPDLSDRQLLNSLDVWLGPFLHDITSRAQFQRLDISRIFRALFSFSRLSTIDRLAPTHIVVPTGSRIPVEYSTGADPVVAVRLQEMFGETRTPAVGGGKVSVLLHILSPAGRPVAVTRDLPSFWKNAYPDVRKDMRGRYPKHHWPEDPLAAAPTKRAKGARRR